MASRFFLVLAVALAITGSPVVEAAPPTYTFCNSCADCQAELASGTWTLVILTVDITDHAGSCISLVSGESHVKFDCDGHVIDGDDFAVDPEYGIYMVSGSDNEIANCTISDFTTGILLAGTTGHIVANNTLVSNTSDGIELFGSTNATVENNVFLANTIGIEFYDSDNNTASGNSSCHNTSRDFSVYLSSGNVGTSNVCDVPVGWNDIKISGCSLACSPFSDGFESGDTDRWSTTVQ
jgi:parallel beta-helix repeat protein